MSPSDREEAAANGPRVDELVEAGRYAEAAAAAREAGDPARAAALYERIWMFADAAACAREADDLAGALKHALDARDEGVVSEIAAELKGRGPEGQKAALAVFERRRRSADAGPLAERLGERDRAIDHYQRAHMDLDAARLLEEAGRVREAGRTLERVLAHSEAPEERSRARLTLGRLLARRAQHEESVRHLQSAAEHPTTRRAARRALIVELAALGFRDASRDVLLEARREDPSLPLDVDAFVRDERDALAGDAEDGDDALVAGRYRLEGEIGAGGSGRVFAARDEVTGRRVAVKLFHSAFARDREAYERFLREAEVARALAHPNVVDVLHVAPEHGALIMEYMAGGSLADRVPPPLPSQNAKKMALEVVAGLEAAHQRGVIHRDVKPANVFFDAGGTAKLGDFGIAHLLDLGQTQTGGLIGTLAYMAPEQVTGAQLTIAADLYGLGVTLFEALTGRLPFLGPDFVAEHLGEPPPAASEVGPGVAPAWDPVLDRLLAKSPADRFEDLDELRRALETLALGGEGAPAPLVLPKAGAAPPRAGAAASAERTARRRRRASTGPVAAGGTAPERRYAYETRFARTANAELYRALDTALDRTVVIERFDPDALDERTETRLLRLARAGGPFLQRALSYDRDARAVVYEAPTGAPFAQMLAAHPLSPRAAIALLEHLARAVDALHDLGGAHGAVSAETILLDEAGYPTLLAAGLGEVPEAPSPADDVAAIVGVVAAAVGAGPTFAEMARALAPEEFATADGAPAPPATGSELYARAERFEIARVRRELASGAQSP